MMLTSTVNLLKTLSLSSGIYAEVLQTDATRTLCGLLRMLVESGANDKGEAATVIFETRFYLILSKIIFVLRVSHSQASFPGTA